MLRVAIYLIFLTLIFQNFEEGNGAKILFYAAVVSHSTRISQLPLMEALTDKGHEVTYLSAIRNYELDPSSKVKRYEPKKLADSFIPWEDQMNYYEVRKNPDVDILAEIFEIGTKACEDLWTDSEFVEWLKKQKFDLVVSEGSAVNECVYGIVHYLNAKLVLHFTSSVEPWSQDAYGLPDESSSTTDMLLGITKLDKMSFIERVKNALCPVWITLLREWSYMPGLEKITRKGLGADAKNMPNFKEIERKINLLLVTSHFSMDDPRSFPPNTIPIGGIVVAKNKKPLPDDMEKFINSGKNGFIYISFGTVVDFNHLDKKVQKEFVNALKSFPEMRFVWKLGKEVKGMKVPENVFVTKWAPQQTILGHDKVKAFVTHAGMGSTVEAIHFGVPLVCVPFLFDQDINADILERRGAGIKVEIVDMKQNELEHAISEILYNEKYRNGMATLSNVFHDRPTPPLESAVWWIEYVLRHDNNYNNLTPPSVHQPWWKKRQIDVWLTVATLFLTVLLMAVFVLKLIVKLITSVSGGKGDERKNKKLKRQ